MSVDVERPLWGVGTFGAADDPRASWEISHDEIGRDIAAATEVLQALDVAGGRVLVCSMLREAGQFWPYVVGTVLAGAQLSCTDATEGDAARVAMFLDGMEYGVVLGITGAVLDGLAALGRDYADVFGRVRVLGARPGAYERLEAAGLAPTRFVLCGPAVAIGREPGGPAYAPEAEWALDSDAGRIVVSSRRPRAQPFDRTPTAVRGEIVDRGVVPEQERSP
jgi:hypothetical protein